MLAIGRDHTNSPTLQKYITSHIGAKMTAEMASKIQEYSYLRRIQAMVVLDIRELKLGII